MKIDGMGKIWKSIAAALLMGSVCAQAGGFAQSEQSAAGSGVANAFVATANDASALAYNPAGIAWLSGLMVTGGFDIEYRDSSGKLPAGISPNTGTEPNFAHVFGTYSPLDKPWSVGVGYAPLYYINNAWSAGFTAPVGVTDLTIDHVTLDAVYAVNSSLALGAGMDWYVSRASFSQGVNTFKGNDFTGVGGHISMMWKPAYSWSIGAMLRSGSKIDVAGGANDSLAFKLPDQATFGIAHDFADVWRLEVDGQWTRWSALKSMHVKTAGVVTQSNPLSLRDTLAIMAGLTWTWRENTQFRVGYAYDQGANKVAGFNPIIADQDGHTVSLGVGGDIYNMHVDLSYQYQYFAKKTVTGAYAGTYRDRRQNVLLSITKTIE